jgi:soluble lytic murein transglycosylase
MDLRPNRSLRGACAALLLAATALAVPEPAAAAPLSKQDEQLYRQAFSAVDDGKWSYARAVAAKAKDPMLAKAIAWFEMSQPDSDASFEDRATFSEANPDWPEGDTFRQHAEESMDDSTRDLAVIAWFGTHEPVTAHGMVRYGEALERTGNAAKAQQVLRQAWVEGNFPLSEERTFLARHKGVLRQEDHLARLDRLLWDGRFDAAHRMLGRVDRGHQALAEARRRLREMEGAVDWALRRVPKELEKDPGLQYDRLRWRRRKDMNEAALEILEHPPADLFRPEMWWTERAVIARRELALGNISLAYRLASRHGLTEGSALPEAEWLAGWIALRFLQEPATAFNHFKQAFDASRYPVSRARGAYWAGRAAELMKDKPGLSQEWYGRAAAYITTYHGQLAASRLDGKKGIDLPADPQPSADDAARFEGRELVTVVRQLGQIGEEARVRPFILHLLELAKEPGEVALIGQLALDANRPDVAVTVAKRAVRTGVVLVGTGYPVPHPPDGDDPEAALLLAMMRQESAFDTLAESSAGARGLMQLMPATAKQMARNLGVDFSHKRLHSDPEYNLKLGAAYLADLLRRFDGSYVLAIAAYNAGPARLRGWMKDNGDPRSREVDAIDWVEMIPFTETRDYVQRVLENLQVYRHRLGKTTVAQSLEDDLHISQGQN